MKRDKLAQENDFFGTGSISRILFKIAPLPGHAEMLGRFFSACYCGGCGGIHSGA